MKLRELKQVLAGADDAADVIVTRCTTFGGAGVMTFNSNDIFETVGPSLQPSVKVGISYDESFCFGLLNYSVAECNDDQNGCPACPPPNPPVRVDKVPPSTPHFPCKGDHWHYQRVDQGPPPTCICRYTWVLARARVDELLIAALKKHRNELTREACASILGERRSRKAVPALLGALSDRSCHVRTDALWAIEKAAGLNVGELCAALLLDMSDWSEVRRRMRAWWRAVKDDPFFA